MDSYCRVIRKYLVYAKERKLGTQLPFSSLTVADYFMYLKALKVGKGTIISSLAALKWLHSFVPGLNSWNNPLNDDFLGKIMSDLNRNITKVNRQKKPLTGEMVAKIISQSNLTDTLALRDCLMIAFAYSLLLRYDEISHISCNHVSEQKNGLKILIPKSKTDKLRNGKNIFLSKSDSATSTYALFSKYLVATNLKLGINHFLFCPLKRAGASYIPTNKRLAYTSYRDIVKRAVKSIGLDEKMYGTHSCRSGGATDLAPHVSQHDLLVTGRWVDPRSLRSYVELPEESRFEISSILEANLNNQEPSDNERIQH